MYSFYQYELTSYIVVLPICFVDSCLRGFTQTIPPIVEWDSYQALDVNGGSFLYPELMFTCNGTLNSVTIPYSTIEGRRWKSELKLDLSVWRRQSEGGYSQEGKDMRVMENIHQETEERVTGNATLQKFINIQKNDILEFTIENYMHDKKERLYKRKHIPYLLTAYQPPGYTKPVIVPLIHVDFNGQPEEGMV